ncbi:MAG: hypothetical protein MUE85_02430 [Microscillaceae bacterium]|jgi:hypothetical protein|nr:hypothetical protein [Microscillaceae bacterium]
MPQFNDLKAAFAWWLENEYPKLPTEDKKNLKYAKYDFVKRNLISQDRILVILEKYTDFELKIEIKERKRQI